MRDVRRERLAEDRAERRQTILMSEWVAQTDRFPAFDELDDLRALTEIENHPRDG